ncbi:hypothetical protein [Porticoccus sp.]
MNLMKLLGISVLVAGLTACGGSESAGNEEKATEAAPAAVQEAAPAVVEEAKAAVEETAEAVTEAVDEVKEAAPEPKKLEIPEGMVEGSVEHSIWLNNQGQ